MQGHAVAPDGCPALDDDKSAVGDGWQRGQGLGGGDGISMSERTWPNRNAQCLDLGIDVP